MTSSTCNEIESIHMSLVRHFETIKLEYRDKLTVNITLIQRILILSERKNVLEIPSENIPFQDTRISMEIYEITIEPIIAIVSDFFLEWYNSHYEPTSLTKVEICSLIREVSTLTSLEITKLTFLWDKILTFSEPIQKQIVLYLLAEYPYLPAMRSTTSL